MEWSDAEKVSAIALICRRPLADSTKITVIQNILGGANLIEIRMLTDEVEPTKACKALMEG